MNATDESGFLPRDRRRRPGPFGSTALHALAAAAVVLSLLLFLLLIWKAAFLFVLIVLGLLLTVLLRGIAVPISHKTHLPEKPVLIAVVVVLAGLIVLTGWLVLPPFVRQIAELLVEVPKGFEYVVGELQETSWGKDVLQQLSLDNIGSLAGDALTNLAGLFTSTLAVLVGLFVILFIGIYVAYDMRLYRNGLLHLVPVTKRKRAEEVLDFLGHTLRWWLIGRLIAMAAVALMTYIGLWILGMPYKFSLSVTAGLLDFVPTIGPIVAGIPAVLLALPEGGMKGLYVVGLYFLVQEVESYLVTPVVQQRTIYLAPALTVCAQIIMGLLLGLPGVLIATPLAASAIVLVKMLYVHDVLGDRIPMGH